MLRWNVILVIIEVILFTTTIVSSYNASERCENYTRELVVDAEQYTESRSAALAPLLNRDSLIEEYNENGTYVIPVVSALEGVEDPYINYKYSLLFRENRLQSRMRFFNLTVKLYPDDRFKWDRDSYRKMVKTLADALNITSFVVDNRVTLHVTEKITSKIKHYIVYIKLKFEFDDVRELDLMVVRIIRRIKDAMTNTQLFCEKSIHIDNIKLANSVDKDNEYDFNLTRTSDELAESMLVSYVDFGDKNYILNLNDHDFVFKFNESDLSRVFVFVKFNKNKLVSTTEPIRCKKNLHLIESSIDGLEKLWLFENYTTAVQNVRNGRLFICLENETEQAFLNEEYAKLVGKVNSDISKSQEVDLFKSDMYLALIFSSISCFITLLLVVLFLIFKKEPCSVVLKENLIAYILLLTLFLIHLSTIVSIVLQNVIKNTRTCLCFAVHGQYLWLVTIFEMNAYAIDLYFKIFKPFSARAQRPPYGLYALYFLLVPLVLTTVPLITHFIDQSANIYNLDYCSLSGRYLLYFFYVPAAILLSVNLIFIIMFYQRLKHATNMKTSIPDKAKKQLLCGIVDKIAMFLGISWLIYIIIGVILLSMSSFNSTVLTTPAQICLHGGVIAIILFLPTICKRCCLNNHSQPQYLCRI